MAKINIEKSQSELNEVLKMKQSLEGKLEELNVKSDELLLEINKTLFDIEKIKEKELILLQEIFIAKKDIIKNSISPSNIKDKIIRSKTFNDIKNTGKIILNTAQEEKNNMDNLYKEYKEKCIQKGEEFKDKKEFKSLLNNLNNIKNFDFSSLLTNLKNEVKTIVEIAKKLDSEHNEQVSSNENIKEDIKEEKTSIDKNITKGKPAKKTQKKTVPVITSKK